MAQRPSIGYSISPAGSFRSGTITSPKGRALTKFPAGVGQVALGTFSATINAFKVKTVQQVNKIVRKSILSVFSRIVIRTPVDTGRARGGWMASFNYAPASRLGIRERWTRSSKKVKYQTPHGAVTFKESKTPQFKGVSRDIGKEFDKEGKRTINKARGFINTIDATKEGIIAYIYNNVHYIIYLEHGHSGQAPSGMVRITLSEWTAIVNSMGGG